MNEEYLWDKSGEPDPQVQQLEEILGTLRYQPRPLEIPKESVVRRRRLYIPVLAIAATIALGLLTAGLWLRIQNQKTRPPLRAMTNVVRGGTKEVVPTPVLARDAEVVKNSKDKRENAPVHRLRSGSQLASNVNRGKSSLNPALSPKDREEAFAAKEQLMMALRVASEKLNLAQRRTQLSSPANFIRNQHKVG